MAGAFSLVNVLADSLGPGTVGFHGEPQNFFMISAILGLCLILCHTCWGVIAFSALDDKNYGLVVFVLAWKRKSYTEVECSLAIDVISGSGLSNS